MINYFQGCKKRIIIFIIVSSIFLGLYNDCYCIKVRAAYDDWIITDDAGKRVVGDNITWYGTHNTGDEDYPRYRTLYYRMSKNTYDIYKPFSSGSNATIRRKDVYVRKERRDQPDGTTSMTYTMSRKEFLEAVTSAEVGLTAEDVIAGKGDIYLNPVYERYLGEKTQATNVFGLQEMLALGWSDTTQDLLPALYNIRYRITAAGNVFDVEYVAEDTNKKLLDGAVNLSGQKITNPLKTDKAMYSERIYHERNEANKKLKYNKKDYTYQYYYYSYTPRGTTEIRKSDRYTSETIDFEAPDAGPGTKLTIHMVYGPSTEAATKYKVNVIAVDTNKKQIKVLQDYKDVKAGDYFDFIIGSSRYTLDKIYNYQYKYYFTYTDPDGDKVTDPTQNATDVNKYEMPNAKEGSKATFYLIYDKGIAPTPAPTPPPDIPEVVAPEPDSAYLEFTDVVNTGKIRADVRGSERFVATLGVPTTESLFGEVRAKEYLLGYRFEKKVGIKYYVITVRKNYTLKWETATPEEAGGGKPVTETVTLVSNVTVPRAFGYWEIENLECYKIDHAVLRNYALPDGSITLNPNYSHYSPPSVNVYHSSDESYHIMKPQQVTTGITLPSQTISAGSDKTSKPSIPTEEFYSQADYAALTQTGKIQVRSDSLVFNGSTVINSAITETEAPDINESAIPQCNTFINENVLYKPNQIIEATKENGTYPSTGTITYTSLAQIGSSKPVKPQYSIDGLNKVVLHTPVICIPSISADNDKYVQLIKPTAGCVQLVLDPDPTLSDFLVNISNNGPHSAKQGYYTRDFSRSLRDPDVSYIASEEGLLMNQVKFPFDVYIDVGGDNDRENDDYIISGTWITIGRSSPRFYLPMWTKEDVYTVDFRTIAVNGKPFLNSTEIYANTDLNRYVATETLNVEVSGRIYGLTMYDLSDYPMWEEAFRVPKSLDFKKDSTKYPDGTALTTYNKGYAYTYTVGTNDQYGNDTGRNIKYTFPLVNGSHPKFTNIGILKTGYLFRFSLETTGNMFSDACMVSIKPNFYFVDKDGKNRTAVDLYYTEAINGKTKHLVKVGSGLDQTNLKSVNTGDLYLGIPQKELKQTAALRNMTYSKFMAQWSPMFNFSNIRLNYAFRTFVNQEYTNIVKSYDSYEEIRNRKVTDRDMSMLIQRWYGQYYIPNEVHVVAKGYDVMDYMDKYGVDYGEFFWLKEGYIIVNFTIETVDENGKRRLSYINASNYMNKGNCSMWTMEGPPLQKTDNKGTELNFYAGDVILYYANKKMSEDYSPGAIY
jgi:hypothetical protein